MKKFIFYSTMLVVIPILGLVDFFIMGILEKDWSAVEAFGKWAGVEGHDPEMF